MSVNLSDHQIKILILFVLRNIGVPIPRVSVTDIFRICDVDFFNMQDAFASLIDGGQIRLMEDDGETFAVISEEGKMLSDTLQKDIPLTVREAAMKAASVEIARIRKELAVENRVEVGEEECVLHLALKSSGTLLFNLSLFTPTVQQAEMMSRRFGEDPLTVYKAILDSLVN